MIPLSNSRTHARPAWAASPSNALRLVSLTKCECSWAIPRFHPQVLNSETFCPWWKPISKISIAEVQHGVSSLSWMMPQSHLTWAKLKEASKTWTLISMFVLKSECTFLVNMPHALYPWKYKFCKRMHMYAGVAVSASQSIFAPIFCF